MMVKLDPTQTRIILEEGTWVESSLTEVAPAVKPSFWEARLDSVTFVEGAEISMERYGGSPQEALGLLFEAMGDAGVTL